MSLGGRESVLPMERSALLTSDFLVWTKIKKRGNCDKPGASGNRKTDLSPFPRRDDTSFHCHRTYETRNKNAHGKRCVESADGS